MDEKPAGHHEISKCVKETGMKGAGKEMTWRAVWECLASKKCENQSLHGVHSTADHIRAVWNPPLGKVAQDLAEPELDLCLASSDAQAIAN